MAGPEEADYGDLFASPAELQAKSQDNIDGSAADTLRALTSATEKIRAAAGWHIAPQRTDTVRLNARGTLLMLPTLRLTELLSIFDDGHAVDVDSLDYGLDDAGDGIILGHSWTRKRGRIIATFRHGYEDVPATLHTLCMQIAARDLGSPLGAIREQTLSSSVTWSATGANTAGGSVILEQEQTDIDPYRRAV